MPRDGVALIGRNGQGKTNLLEAIYYLEIFRSFRGANDDQLITFGSGHFRVVGQLEDGGGEEVEVAAAYARQGRRKKVTVAGREPSRLGDAIGRVGAIVFTASDVDLVAGSPGGRRRYLDIILSLVESGYLASLQRYRQILAQRNELLRDGTAASALEAWDEGLVAEGSRLARARARWIERASPTFARCYNAIAGSDEGEATLDEPQAGPRLRYAPSIPAPDTSDGTAGREDWAAAFQEELARLAGRERRRGVTLVGPHRDDMKFRLSEGSSALDLRRYGSAGQQRTAAVALRMVEAEAIESARNRRPIIMLDDVFAELDPDRAERLVGLVAAREWGQVIVTSPKPNELALLGGRLVEYRIEGGRIRPL